LLIAPIPIIGSFVFQKISEKVFLKLRLRDKAGYYPEGKVKVCLGNRFDLGPQWATMISP